MMVFAFIAVPFCLGEIADRPGGWTAAVITGLVLLPLVLVPVATALRPADAARWLTVAVGVVAGFAVVEAMLPVERVGPLVPIATIVLGVPLAVLGLTHERQGGVLLVAAGLLPLVSLGVTAVRHPGQGDGLPLGVSSGVAGMPVLTVGLLFLLAWAVDAWHGAHRESTTAPA